MRNGTPIRTRSDVPAARPPRIFFQASLAITAAAIVVLAVARVVRWDSFQEPAVFVASTGFVLVALLGGGLRSTYGRYVVGALACCWIGDMVGPHDFMLGTYAFLAAHLLLIPAFLTLRPAWRVTLGAGVVAAIASTLSTGLLWSNMPPADRLPILSYTLAISLMVALAAGAQRHGRFIPAAATLFYISDIFVARWKYLGDDWNGLICYPLYYSACLLFACSVFFIERKELSTEAPPGDPVITTSESP